MELTFAQTMAVMAPFLAVAFIVVSVRLSRRRNGAMTAMLAYSVHSAVYWVTQTVLRWGFDYAGPSVLMASWQTAISVQTVLLLFWFARYNGGDAHGS